MDDSFKKAPIAVPKLSGFDKSHQNLLTSKVGTITPILCDELIPGTKVNLKLALNASLPPLATDTYMRCSIKTEAFFIPMRLLDAGFEDWFSDEPKDFVRIVDGSPVTTSEKAFLPIIRDTKALADGVASWVSTKTGTGTLSDYLGIRETNPNAFKKGFSALPYLAYHKVYHDWYRNSMVQKDVFLPMLEDIRTDTNYAPAAYSPFVFHSAESYIWNDQADFVLADGHSLLDLRQRNFGLDYFSTAMPQPQQGSPMVLSFDTSGSTGEFSIASLRAINSMQQFKDRNGLLDRRYVSQLQGRYGVRPGDAIAQRSLYLGRGEFEVYSKGIYQTNGGITNGDDEPSFAGTLNTNVSANPFASVGARYGSAYASGENFLVNFESKEPGYLMVMATLVPRVTYSSGIRRYMRHYIGEGSLSDMANPILQNVGPQPIYQYEVSGCYDSAGSSPAVFGFTDRYGEFKTMEDELHGLVRDGNSLDAFALQRSFDYTDNVQINSAFLEIPTDYMDNVTAVKEWISEFGFWLDTYFDYKVAMPLSKYSLPTLQDPAYEHGKTLIVNRGGQIL